MPSVFQRLRRSRPPESDAPDRPAPKPPVVFSRGQARLLFAFGAANLILLVVLASLALQAPSVITTVLTPTPLSLPPRPTATPRPTPNVPPPTPDPFGGGGAIAFVLRRNGNSDIYAIDVDREGLIRLTSNPADDRDPAFSPDGTQLAFASHRDGSWNIYRMDLESGVTRRLTFTTTYSAAPAWSPDGQWIAFESYRNNTLNLYMMRSEDGSQVTQLTTDAGLDMNPAWSPDGKSIVFSSYRSGNKDIYLLPLDTTQGEKDLADLTNSPDRDEDNPAWSPDGLRLAYTSGRPGDQLIYVNTFDPAIRSLQEADVGLFGQGSGPAWSPDRTTIAFTYHRGSNDALIAANIGGWGIAREAFGGREFISHPSWTAHPLSEGVISRTAAEAPLAAPPLYTEVVSPTAPGQPQFAFVRLDDVAPGGHLLSDAVDDSFRALRARVQQETGTDYLSLLGSSWRPMDHVPREGQSRRSYHVAGRAIDIDQTPYNVGSDQTVFAREDIGYRTFWRVFIKASQQDGTQGEPLREAPWSLVVGSETGGQPMEKIPPGYYVDFTTLAADYGWERVQAIYRWRTFYPDVEWWHFQKTDGLPWWDAMKQVYHEKDIIDSYGPYPGRDN
jgi:TolB protein